MKKRILLTLATVLLLVGCSNPEKELATALKADTENFETIGEDLYTQTSDLLSEIKEINQGGVVSFEKSLKEAEAYAAANGKLNTLITSYDDLIALLDTHLEIHDTYKGKKEETLDLRVTFESLKSEYEKLSGLLGELKTEVTSVHTDMKELSDLAYAYEQAKAKGTQEGENTIYFTSQYDLNEMNRLQDETNAKIDSTNTKNKSLIIKLMSPGLTNTAANVLLENYIGLFDEETQDKKE